MVATNWNAVLIAYIYIFFFCFEAGATALPISVFCACRSKYIFVKGVQQCILGLKNHWMQTLLLYLPVQYLLCC